MPNETSWTYFKKYFANYLAGERFPVLAPLTDSDC
jgi:hypothetical protein